MPFTVSHIAAITPFYRSRLSFAALAIGSMSPDFSYVIALLGPRIEAHSLGGLFYFAVPITLFTWWMFRFYIAPAWQSVFPWLIQDESKPVLWIVVVSAALGAATHLIWDSFTHRYGWPVQNAEFLRNEISVFGTRPRPIYGLLQHASTLCGGVIVIALLHKTIKTRGAKFIGSWRYFSIALAAAILLSAAFSLPLFSAEFESFDSRAFEILLVKFAFRSMAAAAITIALFPLWLRIVERRA